MTRPLTTYARSAAATLATLALVVGVPLGLVHLAGWPLPRSVPSLSEMRESFDRQGVPPEVLINVLVVIVWLAWAQIVWALAAEVVAVARGRAARRGPVVPGIQLLAARLVAGIAVVVSTLGPVRAVGAAPLAPPPAEHVAALHLAGAGVGTPSPPPPASTVAEPQPEARHAVYEAQRGDSFWRLAQERLGDGTRWREIRDLNVGRAVAAGRVLGANEDRLQPGWRILIPETDAAPEMTPIASRAPATNHAASAPPAGDGGPDEVTVEAGDSLWGLSESHLRSAWEREPSDGEVTPFWREVVNDNRARLPDPADPDLIFPGQRLVLPEPPVDPEARNVSAAPGPARPDAASEPGVSGPTGTSPAEGAGEIGAADGVDGGDGAGAAGQSDAAEGTDVLEGTDAAEGADVVDEADVPDGADAGGIPTAPAEPVPTAPAEPAPTPAAEGTGLVADDAAGEQAARGAPIGLIGGGLALGGMVLLLDRRRRARQRHRRPGGKPPLPDRELAVAEQKLRSGADTERARFVDAALRAAAAGSGAGSVPELRWVEATSEHVTLVLTEPAPAPPGFTENEAVRWQSSLPARELAELGERAVALAPALVPVGTTETGADVLVDLEAAGVVTVAGPPERTVPFLRSLAVALATAPWIEQPRVVLVGLGGEVTAVPWVETVDSFAAALDAVEARAEQTVTALGSLGCLSTGQARAAGATPDAWEPLVVISADPPTEGDDERLRRLSDRSGQAVAVVSPPAAIPRGRLLALDEEGWLRVDGAFEPIRARQLDDRDGRVIARLLGDDEDGRDRQDPVAVAAAQMSMTQFASRVGELLDGVGAHHDAGHGGAGDDWPRDTAEFDLYGPSKPDDRRRGAEGVVEERAGDTVEVDVSALPGPSGRGGPDDDRRRGAEGVVEERAGDTVEVDVSALSGPSGRGGPDDDRRRGAEGVVEERAGDVFEVEIDLERIGLPLAVPGSEPPVPDAGPALDGGWSSRGTRVGEDVSPAGPDAGDEQLGADGGRSAAESAPLDGGWSSRGTRVGEDVSPAGPDAGDQQLGADGGRSAAESAPAERDALSEDHPSAGPDARASGAELDGEDSFSGRPEPIGGAAPAADAAPDGEDRPPGPQVSAVESPAAEQNAPSGTDPSIGRDARLGGLVLDGEVVSPAADGSPAGGGPLADDHPPLGGLELEEVDVAPGADGSPSGERLSVGEDAPAEADVLDEEAGPSPPAVSGVDDLLGDVDVLVRVLGEVEMVRLDPEGESPLAPSRQKGLEAISYLAVRQGPVDREGLESILFPSGANAVKTYHNVLSSARQVLGEELFPPPQSGRYELSERVTTDYALLCELAAVAEDTDDAEAAVRLLTEALTLVRGEPFIGAGRGYSWVAPHRSVIVAQVVDIAEEVAEVYLAIGDWRRAEWATRQGLRAFPCDERMYRLLMRAAHAAGNTPGVQQIYRELCDALADPDRGVEPDDTVHPETVELLEQLTGGDRSGRRSA